MASNHLADQWALCLCLKPEEIAWPLSERRHPACLRGDTLVSLGEEVPWSLFEGRQPGLCLRGEPWSFYARSWPGLCLRGETLFSVWGESLIFYWEKSPWSLSMGRHSGPSQGRCLSPCLRGDSLVPFWEETSWSWSEGRCSGLWEETL